MELAPGTQFCGCGCGEVIGLRGKNGKPCKYKMGHCWNNRKHSEKTKERYSEDRKGKTFREYNRDKSPELFWNKINKDGESGCWLWTGFLEYNGYGRFGSSRNRTGVHRYSWELVNGPIPEDMVVIHKCDVRHCVNPDHLMLGTQADNMKDMTLKDRSDKREGTKNQMAKLNDDIVRQIRIEYRTTRITHAELGAKYGVSGTNIGRIISGKQWGHVKD